MQTRVRLTAMIGIVAILLGGIVSAYRHEEIYIMCPIVWCKAAAHVIQAVGLGSWEMGAVLVGASLLIAFLGSVGTVFLSLVVQFLPKNLYSVRTASTAYFLFACGLGIPLYFIYTNDRLGSLFKNATGPRLSHDYAALPLLLCLCAIVLMLSSTGPEKAQVPSQ